MCESLISAQSFLTDSDPNLRSAALVAIAHLWQPDHIFKDACEELVLADPSPKVRKCAMAALFICYRGTDDARLGELVGLVTYDNSLPRELRHYAYRLLFQLYLPRRITVSHPPAPDSAGFRFPEDVDWKLVDSFLYRQPDKRKQTGGKTGQGDAN